jgi:hypothetical protein
MAGVPLLPADVLLSKRVQEMVLNGEEPPHLYVCREGDATQEISSTLSSIPVIDFNLLSTSAPSSKQEEVLEQLRSALCSWGCFQVSTQFLFLLLLQNNIKQSSSLQSYGCLLVV